MAATRILNRGPVENFQYELTAEMYPGACAELTFAGKAQKVTGSGMISGASENLILLEDAKHGSGVTIAIASGRTAEFVVPGVGAVLNVLVDAAVSGQGIPVCRYSGSFIAAAGADRVVGVSVGARDANGLAAVRFI